MGLLKRGRSLRAYGPGRRALTASGQRLNRKGAEQQRLVKQRWQKRAFGFYDELGVIKYASQFYSRPLSKLRLFAAEVDDKGELTETENPQVIAQLERIQDPGGGRAQMLSTYGRLMFLVGEAVLLVSDNEGEEQWEFLSTDEVRVEPGEPTRYMRVRAPSLGQEELVEPSEDDYTEVTGDQAMAYRIWKRHPLYSHWPDAPMRGVLDIAEELVILTRAIRSTATSRIAKNGLLLIPDGITAVPLSAVPDEDPEEDPVMSVLIQAMITAIQDEHSASAQAPVLLRGDPELLKAISHVQMVDPLALYPEMGVRAELIKRLAVELDMPPAALLGIQDSNHWNGYMIDEQSWKDHQEPIARALVDDLTQAFFRPTLRDEGIEDFAKYRIAYDASEVVVHPDRTADARELHDRAVIGDDALRDAHGFEETDAATEEEVNRRLGILTRDSSLAIYGIPSIRSGTIEPQPGEIVDSGGTQGTPVPDQQPADNGQPPPPSDVTGSIEAARIVGAAQLVLLRAREAAGARLWSLSKRDQALHKELANVPRLQIAAVLGPERAAGLNAPAARELVAGGTELLREVLKQFGIEGEKDVEFLAEQIERHAARTLYDETPKPLPAAFANSVLELRS